MRARSDGQPFEGLSPFLGTPTYIPSSFFYAEGWEPRDEETGNRGARISGGVVSGQSPD